MATMTWRGVTVPVPDDLRGRPYSVLPVLLDGAPACVVPGHGLVRIYRTLDGDDDARSRDRWTVESITAAGDTCAIVYRETAADAMREWSDQARVLATQGAA